MIKKTIFEPHDLGSLMLANRVVMAPDPQQGGASPVAPSAIRAEAKIFINNGFADVSEPRAIELGELPVIVNGFRQAAANAIAAGFDGVEVHGAKGYVDYPPLADANTQ